MGFCILDEEPEGTSMYSHRMGEGYPMGDKYPANAQWHMTDRFPGIKLPSLIATTGVYVVVERKLKEVFERTGVSMECLNSTLYDHKGREASRDYFILNDSEKLRSAPDFFRIQEDPYVYVLSHKLEGFFAELSRSARAFLAFLQHADDEARATSRSEPFFDAVACADVEAEKGIARHSRPSWHEGEEYEDDFLYVRFLMKRFTLHSPEPACEALLERYAAVLGAGGDPRLEVCQALLACDADLFEEGFERFLDARTRALREKVEAERLHPDDAPTTAHLSVEVLALLCFAERAGLTPDAHLPLAPSVARHRSRARLPPPDAWRRPLLAMDGARRAP